jgi:hypothetical protein
MFARLEPRARPAPRDGFRVAAPIVHHVLQAPGQPLGSEVQATMGAHLGHDFSRVRVHVDTRASRSADALNANAYTIGRDIVFGPHKYAPGTPTGRRLLAHELAHVVQQDGARLALADPIPVSAPTDLAEERAQRKADDLAGVHESSAPGRSSPVGQSPMMVQRDFGAPIPQRGGLQGADAVIPIERFIQYVEEVERANPGDQPQEILSRIRVQYYGSSSQSSIIAFDQLIPEAHAIDLVQSGDPEMPSVSLVPRRLGSVSAEARSHLLAHADEYRPGDNPSPYLLLPNKERIDVGHLFLGLDALLHPRTASPYTDYGVPNIDPAGWVADVGIASVWLTHAEEGDPHPGAPPNPPPATVDNYFRLSAPDEDLLGDIDAYRAQQQWQEQPGTLSAAIRRYYLGGAGTGGADVRYQTFCAKAGLTFQRSGNSITWDTKWRYPLIDRIDRFNDLYESGKWGAIKAMTVGSVEHRFWPRTAIMLDKFLNWLKPRLEDELSRSAAGSRPRAR